MHGIEQKTEPSMTLQTEYEEWLQAGCKKAEEIINKSYSKTDDNETGAAGKYI